MKTDIGIGNRQLSSQYKYFLWSIAVSYHKVRTQLILMGYGCESMGGMVAQSLRRQNCNC